MKKLAYSSANWRRLITSLRKEAPWIFPSLLGRISNRLRGRDPIAYLLKRFPRVDTLTRSWYGPERRHAHRHLLQTLRRLEAGVRRGKPLSGGQTQAKLDQLQDYLLGPKSMRALTQSVAPKITRDFGVPGLGRAWRGTSIGKLTGIKPGQNIWVSGDPFVGRHYSATGGVLGKDMPLGGNLLLELKKPGIKFMPEGSIYEAIIKKPKDPLEDVVRIWRSLGAENYVPVSKESLGKWIQARRAPEVLKW